jgi:hypothetical protein
VARRSFEPRFTDRDRILNRILPDK